MAPACRQYGNTYKWLFYGDDDTVFFLDAAVNVLQHLDPDLPFFLTGEALFRWAWGVKPRCLPGLLLKMGREVARIWRFGWM